MNQPSEFQLQYPLSPKKFWKKLLPNIFTYFVLALVSGVGIGFALLAMSSHLDTEYFSVTSLIFYSIVPFVIIWAGCLALTAWYIRVYIRRYYYDCGEQFITIKKGVFAPTEIHVQYQKIQDVYVDQDILDRIMGLYDVHIASATVTSGIEAHIDGVNAEAAESLKNIILNKIHGANGNSNSTQPISIQPAQTPVAHPVFQSQGKVSSDTYPMGGSWVVSAIFGSIFYSLFYTIVFLLFFGRIAEVWGFSFPFYTAFFVVVFLVRIIWQSIWKSNFYFEFMPDYILLRTGVVSRQENHLPYKSIQNILNNQSIIDKMLGLSKVTIQNAAVQMIASSRGRQTLQGSGISLPWQPYAKAEELNNILNDIVSKISPQNSSNMMGL